MDLIVGIHEAGGAVGIRATCGIARERRRVQHRKQHAHQHRSGKRIEEAHGRPFRVSESPHELRRTDIPWMSFECNRPVSS